MLVQIKRSFFSKDGVHYDLTRGSTIEVPDDWKVGIDLPKDAKVLHPTGSLPATAPAPIPGYQAKPEWEQKLDLIPGAAPSDQIVAQAPDDPTPATDEEKAEQKKLADEAAKKAAAEKKADDEAHLKDDKAATQKGLETIKKAEDAESKLSGGAKPPSALKL